MLKINIEVLRRAKHYLEQYNDFANYFQTDFIESEYQKFVENYDNECGINCDVLFGIHIQNKINHVLCSKIKAGDIELEIKLISKNLPILELILRRLNITDDIDKEGILIRSFESYDGSKLLSLHILDVLRGKEVKSCEPVVKTEESKESKSCKPVAKVKKSKKVVIPFEDRVRNYIKEKNLPVSNPTFLENLFVTFNVFDYIEDEDLKKYAYLKFGFYDSHYFKDEDIISILSTSDITSMNKRCLLLLKNVMDSKVDNLLEHLLNSKDDFKNKIKTNSK